VENLVAQVTLPELTMESFNKSLFVTSTAADLSVLPAQVVNVMAEPGSVVVKFSIQPLSTAAFPAGKVDKIKDTIVGANLTFTTVQAVFNTTVVFESVLTPDDQVAPVTPPSSPPSSPPSPSGGGSSSSINIGIILGAVAGGLLLVALAVFAFVRQRRKINPGSATKA